MRKRYYLGRCYANAFNWACDHEGEHKSLRIVHGYPIGMGSRPCGHAWLEFDGVCFEPAGGVITPNGAFYFQHRIDRALCRRYTLKQVGKLIGKHNNYGPWHEIPPNAFFSEPKRRPRKSKS